MLRLVAVSRAVVARAPAAVRSVRMFSSELTDVEFDAKWTNYFDDKTLTQREVRSGLNDVFAHDAVPARPVLEAALRATRRVNDFPTSVRIFEGIKDKAQNEDTYKQVVASLRPVIAELQLSTPEEIGFA